MSRITIVPDDQVVTVDGVPVWFAYSFASDVNAVQWYETIGTPLRAQAQIDQCNATDGWHWDASSDSCVRDS